MLASAPFTTSMPASYLPTDAPQKIRLAQIAELNTTKFVLISKNLAQADKFVSSVQPTTRVKTDEELHLWSHLESGSRRSLTNGKLLP